MEHIELNAESRWFFITHHMNGSCRKFFKETLSLITSTVSLQGACSQNNAGMHALFKFNPRQRFPFLYLRVQNRPFLLFLAL